MLPLVFSSFHFTPDQIRVALGEKIGRGKMLQGPGTDPWRPSHRPSEGKPRFGPPYGALLRYVGFYQQGKS